MIKIVGLTGRMSSGKSTAAEFFKQLGCEIIFADKLAKLVLNEQETILQIENFFGKEVFKADKISPTKLAKQCFKNNKNLSKLMSITHPKIAQKFSLALNKIKNKKQNTIVIYDAPLLLEAGIYKKMDKNILVVTDDAISLQRWKKKIKNNTHFQESDLQNRIQYQIESQKAKKLVDFIIDGNQDFSGVQKQVQAIYQKILASMTALGF